MAVKFDGIRERLMADCKTLFEGLQYEVLRTGSNEICLPIVDENGEEGYMVLTFKIPKGSRDGDIYDGYEMANEYSMKCAEKAEKAKESAKKKAEKIERDKKMREEKARLKAEREAQKNA